MPEEEEEDAGCDKESGNRDCSVLPVRFAVGNCAGDVHEEKEQEGFEAVEALYFAEPAECQGEHGGAESLKNTEQQDVDESK